MLGHMAITPNGRVADASPLGKGPRRLSDYEREIAHALMRKGHPKQEAIIIARGLLKKAAASGRWGDHGKAGAKTRAGARASIAQRKDFTAEAVADLLLAYNAAEPRDSHHPVGLSNVVAEMLVDLAYNAAEKRDSKGRWTKGVKDVLDTIAQINTAHSLDQMFPDSGVHAAEEGKQRGKLTDLLKKDPNLYENPDVRTALKGAGLGRMVTGHDYLKSRTPEQQAKAAADLDALHKQRDKNREKAEAKKALEAVRSELNDLVSDYEMSEDFGPEHGIGKQVADLLKAHPEMLKDRRGKALLKYHPELTGVPPSYAQEADENGWADMDASGGSPSQAASMHEEHAAQITSQFWHDTMLDSAPEDEHYARSLWEQYQNPDLYGKINAMLRTGKREEGDPKVEDVRRYAQVMFDKAGTTLTKPMTVFRALRSDPRVGDTVAGVKLEKPIVGGRDWAARLTPGSTFKDDGIVSSTAHDHFAEGWLGLGPGGEEKGKEHPNDVVMEIRLKPGQRIVGGSEQFIETMLPPGTTFRIVSSEPRHAKTPRNPLGDYAMDPFDYTHVVAEVVD